MQDKSCLSRAACLVQPYKAYSCDSILGFGPAQLKYGPLNVLQPFFFQHKTGQDRFIIPFHACCTAGISSSALIDMCVERHEHTG